MLKLPTRSVGLPRGSLIMEGVVEYCNYARCKTHASGVMYVGLSWQTPIDRDEHQEEGMKLVIKEQEISFSTADNVP